MAIRRTLFGNNRPKPSQIHRSINIKKPSEQTEKHLRLRTPIRTPKWIQSVLSFVYKLIPWIAPRTAKLNKQPPSDQTTKKSNQSNKKHVDVNKHIDISIITPESINTPDNTDERRYYYLQSTDVQKASSEEIANNTSEKVKTTISEIDIYLPASDVKKPPEDIAIRSTIMKSVPSDEINISEFMSPHTEKAITIQNRVDPNSIDITSQIENESSVNNLQPVPLVEASIENTDIISTNNSNLFETQTIDIPNTENEMQSVVADRSADVLPSKSEESLHMIDAYNKKDRHPIINTTLPDINTTLSETPQKIGRLRSMWDKLKNNLSTIEEADEPADMNIDYHKPNISLSPIIPDTTDDAPEMFPSLQDPTMITSNSTVSNISQSESNHTEEDAALYMEDTYSDTTNNLSEPDNIAEVVEKVAEQTSLPKSPEIISTSKADDNMPPKIESEETISKTSLDGAAPNTETDNIEPNNSLELNKSTKLQSNDRESRLNSYHNIIQQALTLNKDRPNLHNEILSAVPDSFFGGYWTAKAKRGAVRIMGQKYIGKLWAALEKSMISSYPEGTKAGLASLTIGIQFTNIAMLNAENKKIWENSPDLFTNIFNSGIEFMTHKFDPVYQKKMIESAMQIRAELWKLNPDGRAADNQSEITDSNSTLWKHLEISYVYLLDRLNNKDAT